MSVRLRIFAAVAALMLSCAVGSSARLAVADTPTPPTQPAAVDAASAPDEATARAIAAAYDHPVAVNSETTEDSQVVANADGTLALSSSPIPVRAQGADGSWSPLDLSLQPDGAQLTPQTAAVPVKFSAGGSAPLAQVQAASGQWLTESWTAGQLPTPVVSGGSAIYPEVMPGVDLQVTATATGMSDVLVVKSAQAAADPGLKNVVFGVDDGSMSSVVNANGSLTTSSGSTPQLISDAPTWWDSSSPGASAAGPGGDGVPIPIAHTSTPTSVAVDAASAANTAGVTYPIYVDPPVGVSGNRVSYTYTDSAYPNTSYWNGAGASDAYAHVGYINAGNSDDGYAHTARSYWTLDTSALANRYIVSAAFNTTEVYSSSCNATDLELWTSTASSPSLTWANQGQQVGLNNKLAQTAMAHGYSSACPASSVGFDVQAPVQRIATAGVSTLNLAFKATNESDWLSWKKFRNDPYLYVVYEDYPSKPYFRSVSGCYAACDSPAWTHLRQPYLAGQAGSVESTQVSYNFQLYAGTSASPTTLVASGTHGNLANGTTAHWMVPVALTNGAVYEYRVQACNADSTDPSQNHVCGEWTDYFQFGVDTTAPNPPIVSAVNNDFQFFTGPQSPPPTNRYGQQNVPGDVYLADTASGVYQYIYAPEPSLSFVASSASPCNTTTGDIVSVCDLLNNSGSGKTISITPQEDVSTLTVLAIDEAGNVSNGTTVTYYPNNTLVAQAQHAWLQPTAGSTATSVTDTGTASTAAPLNLASGITFGSDDNGPYAYTGRSYDGYLNLPGTTGQAATTAAAGDTPADISDSMTASIWVKPTPRSGSETGYQAVFSQDGAAESGFEIQRTPDEHWRACMPEAQTNTATLDCTDPSQSPPVDTQNWTLLILVWDAPQKKFTLYFTDTNHQSVSLAHTVIAPAATGPIAVGRSLYHSGVTDWYHGSLADPLLWPVALANAQIQNLQFGLPAAIGGQS